MAVCQSESARGECGRGAYNIWPRTTVPQLNVPPSLQLSDQHEAHFKAELRRSVQNKGERKQPRGHFFAVQGGNSIDFFLGQFSGRALSLLNQDPTPSSKKRDRLSKGWANSRSLYI